MTRPELQRRRPESASTSVDDVNAAGGVAGYDLKFIHQDTDTTPATSIRAATQAVTQEGAQILDFQTSPENAAINPQLAGFNALAFNSIAQNDGLIRSQCVPNAFHLVPANSMLINSLQTQMPNITGNKWAIIAADYSMGHGATTAFKASTQKLGKSVVSEQFAPLGTTDFGTYITQIQQSGADPLLVVMFGADGDAFINQATQSGSLRS
ncbi:ABC transporter substrate-binding protein [Micromonospora sp. NPDC005161]